MVQEVVEQVWECLVAGTAWEDPGAAHGGGAVLAIDPGSKYEHEVLRKLEDGVSYKVTRDLVNRLLVRDGRAAVCETAVINCMRRCSPRYTSVQFVSQANRDGACEWAIVRHRLTAQFRIQLGEWKPTLADLKGRGLVKATATSIPACFDRTQLESIALERIGFWDETHKKQRIGWEKPTASKGGVVLQFPRDPETGEYCPESEGGMYLPPPTETNVKYPAECRICCGVHLKGRFEMFAYNGKMIVGIKKWDELKEAELRSIRGLTDDDDDIKKWKDEPRPAGQGPLYKEDTELGRLGGRCNEEAERILKTPTDDWRGIQNIGNLCDLSAADEAALFKLKIRGAGQKTKEKWLEAARGAAEGEYPGPTNHTDADNPYLSKYGEELWEERLANCSRLTNKVNVKDMVRHIYTETKRVMEAPGDPCPRQKWWFYHDALAQMCTPECRECMKEVLPDGDTIYEHWLLPSNDLNAEHKYWLYRVCGNSPELMPLDTYLFADLHNGLSRMVAITRGLAQDDARKYSMATPKLMLSAYQRLWWGNLRDAEGNMREGGDAIPSKSRVEHDVRLWIQALRRIFNKKGAHLPDPDAEDAEERDTQERVGGVTNAMLQQADMVVSSTKKKHGGHRTKRPWIEMWMPDDIVALLMNPAAAAPAAAASADAAPAQAAAGGGAAPASGDDADASSASATASAASSAAPPGAASAAAPGAAAGAATGARRSSRSSRKRKRSSRSRRRAAPSAAAARITGWVRGARGNKMPLLAHPDSSDSSDDDSDGSDGSDGSDSNDSDKEEEEEHRAPARRRSSRRSSR